MSVQSTARLRGFRRRGRTNLENDTVMDSPSARVTRGAAPALPALAPLFDTDLELGALERMLLELAVHPDGAGAASAWWLIWEPRRGVLEGWRSAVATSASEPLGDALGRARRAPPGDGPHEARAWSGTPDSLGGALAEAWRGSTIALGADPPPAASPCAGASRVGAIAVRRGPRAFGLLVTAWNEAGADPGARHRLEWLRDAANAALAAQFGAETARRRGRQTEALAEFARAAVSSINVAEALHLLARLAAQGTASRGSAVYRGRSVQELAVAVAYGPGALRDTFATAFTATAAAALESRQTLCGDDPREAPALPPGVGGETTSWAALPLEAYGQAFGALVVHDGLERHPASPGLEREDVIFLTVLADHAGLLLAHAHATEAVRRAERRLTEQRYRLQEVDRLSAVGEMAARVARESRNPITSIAAFARRAQRELREEDPLREYLEIVVREAERLEAMLQEQHAYSHLERGRLRLQNLNDLVQEALMRSSETLVRRRVRLLKKLATDLPDLLLDAARIRRVIENVVSHALESVPSGGRIKVESRRAGDWVAVEIAHDGSHAGGELLDQLFVPFAVGQWGGAAVGLGVAHQIVREHGGEVRVRSEHEWATVFSFTLPIRGNEDRRRAGERRATRTERRRRGPEPGEAQGGV